MSPAEWKRVPGKKRRIRAPGFSSGGHYGNSRSLNLKVSRPLKFKFDRLEVRLFTTLPS